MNRKEIEELMDRVEAEMVRDGISAIERSIKNHDMETAFTIMKMCKCIAGDKFDVRIEL